MFKRIFAAGRVQMLGSVLGAAVVVLLIVPKAAHAVAAALVQVTNTLSNPVISLVNHKAASQLVQLAVPGGGVISASATPTRLAQYDTATANIGSTPYVVPAGQSLVITDIDFDIFSSGDVGILISNGNSTPTTFGQFYERFDFSNVTNETEHINLGSGLVFPAGATVAVTLPGGPGYITAVLRGYLTPA